MFCGSKHGVSPAYTEGARLLAQTLVKHKIGLVYGGGAARHGFTALSQAKHYIPAMTVCCTGGTVGLMGEIAQGVREKVADSAVPAAKHASLEASA